MKRELKKLKKSLIIANKELSNIIDERNKNWDKNKLETTIQKIREINESISILTQKKIPKYTLPNDTLKLVTDLRQRVMID
jgi:hypothetical protein